MKLSVEADVIGLAFDENVVVVFRAAMFDPRGVARTVVAARDGPGTRERVVGGRYFVAQDIRIFLVEKNPLLDDGLVVLMHGDTARVENSRALQMVRLDFKRVVAAVSIGIDPLADGKGGLGIFGPVAA